jgi:hypothetical protein
VNVYLKQLCVASTVSSAQELHKATARSTTTK